MDLKLFLQTVVTGKEGFFCLALGVPNGQGWWEEWFQWPQDLDAIVKRAISRRDEQNVYFSTYLFSKPQSVKANVLPTRTIQADLDNASILQLPQQPTVLVETSPGRHQAFWVLREAVDLEQHEILSRKVTYAIEGCDRSGWPLGRKVRVPDTINHKYLDGPKQVRVISTHVTPHDAATVELLPDVSQVVIDHYDEDFLENPPSLSIGPQELLAKSKINAKIKAQYDTADKKDRSAALWALMCEGFRSGLTRDEVYWLAKHSANNKFERLRYHAERELAKDVLRAENKVNSNIVNPRQIIDEIRRLPGASSHDKRVQMFTVIVDIMQKEGQFIHTPDDNIWYIRKDLGRPINVAPRSDYFGSLMFVQYGLVQVEAEYQYVAHAVMNYVKTLPPSGLVRALSHFDRDSNTMLLHTGSKDVLIISAQGVVRGTDGAHGVIFPWVSNVEAFTYSKPKEPWQDILFGGCLDNVMGTTKEEAMAILRGWLLFMLMRNMSSARPLLTLLGQPGCVAGNTLLDIRIGDYSKSRATIRDLHRVYRANLGLDINVRSLKNGVVKYRPINSVFYSGTKTTYDVTVSNRAPFRTTNEHRFLTPTGYKPLSELRVGDDVIAEYLLTTTTERIESITRYGEEETYDIEMRDKEAPNFLVNGVVVHNSGKSTIFKRIYRLLYGAHRAVTQLTTMDDFDHAVTSMPFVAYDNADTFYPWLPDRLAMSATVSDYPKRKLYSDGDIVTLQRDAMVGITAHDPKFGRGDVADRLLILNFHRLTEFRSEGDILDTITKRRSEIWGGIVDDLQRVLCTSLPPEHDAPQFRIEDYARVGHWIARALGFEQDFVSAINRMRVQQKTFALEEEPALVQTLLHFANKHKDDERFHNANTLWQELYAAAQDTKTFTTRYKSASAINKKLWTLQEPLSQVVQIEWETDTAKSQRVWRIKPLNGVNNNGTAKN